MENSKELVEKIAAGFRSQLNIDSSYLILSNISGKVNSWSLVDCTLKSASEAGKAFSKRVSNTSLGIFALVDPTNTVVSFVDCSKQKN